MSAALLATARPGTSATVCALLQSDGAGQPCPACQAAQARAHSPLFRAHCHGCKVRALAQGPQFWRSLKGGAHTDAYQGELAAVFGAAGARMEMPGCSLCMGNQAQVKEGATVMSTSTRNFPNRLGKNTNVYLGSAELSAICSKLGRIPSKEEYLADMGVLNQNGDKIYKYLNFDQTAEFKDVADGVTA